MTMRMERPWRSIDLRLSGVHGGAYSTSAARASTPPPSASRGHGMSSADHRRLPSVLWYTPWLFAAYTAAGASGWAANRLTEVPLASGRPSIAVRHAFSSDRWYTYDSAWGGSYALQGPSAQETMTVSGSS